MWSCKNGRLFRHGRPEGLHSVYLTCLHVDDDQALWIGTKGGGLWRHRDGKFIKVGTDSGLPFDTVMSITAGAEGHLWMATAHGLVRLSRAELNDCADGARQKVGYLQLDLTDGLKSLEFEGPNQPNACRASDGRMWFATGAGLAQVDEASLYTNSRVPQIGRAHV